MPGKLTAPPFCSPQRIDVEISDTAHSGGGAIIRGIFTMPAAQQTSGRLSMQRLGLNIYSWQPRKEDARICRVGLAGFI